jgi:predicted enzyme related to lactoylglutathione lyase
MSNAISWFEIPTTQLDQAQAIYQAVLQRPMRREAMGPSLGAVMGFFAHITDLDGNRVGLHALV